MEIIIYICVKSAWEVTGEPSAPHPNIKLRSLSAQSCSSTKEGALLPSLPPSCCHFGSSHCPTSPPPQHLHFQNIFFWKCTSAPVPVGPFKKMPPPLERRAPSLHLHEPCLQAPCPQCTLAAHTPTANAASACILTACKMSHESEPGRKHGIPVGGGAAFPKNHS